MISVHVPLSQTVWDKVKIQSLNQETIFLITAVIKNSNPELHNKEGVIIIIITCHYYLILTKHLLKAVLELF